jgi:hypothetical protein
MKSTDCPFLFLTLALISLKYYFLNSKIPIKSFGGGGEHFHFYGHSQNDENPPSGLTHTELQPSWQFHSLLYAEPWNSV